VIGYFNLSVYAMIITAFLMKVVRLVRGKKRPGLAPNGLTPEEWDYAMFQAKICLEMKLVLQISNGSGTASIDWIVGPSLGDAADRTFMHWCWCNLEQFDGFYLSGIDRRLPPRGRVHINPSWPLSIKNWADMANVYNALLHQAELRERSK
jgi:hypothetical protein